MPQRGQETVIRVLRLWRRRDIPRRTRPTRVYPYCARHVSRTYRLSVVCTPRYDACATKVIVRGAHAGPRTLGHPPSGCGIDPRFFGIAQASPAGRSSAAARPGRAALPGFVEGARSMSKKRFANVWDAIEDTPAQAENMKLRSALIMALNDHIARTGLSQSEAAKRQRFPLKRGWTAPLILQGERTLFRGRADSYCGGAYRVYA